MTEKNITVALGMSGGVDSSLAATLLLNEGYRVIGLTMAVYGGEPISGKDKGHACYGPGEEDDLKNTESVANHLGIEHHVIDLKNEYKTNVLDYFRNEYSCGRTPNPCTRCNPKLKFGQMIEKAKASGISFDSFATGHYIRNEYNKGLGRYQLKTAVYLPKDQSYFLYGLNANQLKDLIFPLGSFSKMEVRQKAKEFDLPVCMRPESQDFIEGGNYSGLFDEDKKMPGNIVDPAGKKLGVHKGIIHYTIGQRKGIGIAAAEPLYVIDIIPQDNCIVAGPKEMLFADTLLAKDVNFVSVDIPDAALSIQAKIRQNHTAQDAILYPEGEGRFKVVFKDPQMAITKGQSVVFYNNEIVLGGGVIDEVIKNG